MFYYYSTFEYTLSWSTINDTPKLSIQCYKKAGKQLQQLNRLNYVTTQVRKLYNVLLVGTQGTHVHIHNTHTSL